MDTEEIVIDEDVMEMAEKYSARTGKSVEDILDRYVWFCTEGYKKYQDVDPEILEIRQQISLYYTGNDKSDDW